VDASSGALEDQMRSTRDTLDDLGHSDDPCLLVFNKIDRVPAGVLDRLGTEYPEAVFLSAIDPSQADFMETRVRAGLRAARSPETLVPPAAPSRTAWELGRGSGS